MQFSELKLSESLLRAVADLGFTHPTPIQAEAIPAILTGRDVIGSARTGTVIIRAASQAVSKQNSIPTAPNTIDSGGLAPATLSSIRAPIGQIPAATAHIIPRPRRLSGAAPLIWLGLTSANNVGNSSRWLISSPASGPVDASLAGARLAETADMISSTASHEPRTAPDRFHTGIVKPSMTTRPAPDR